MVLLFFKKPANIRKISVGWAENLRFPDLLSNKWEHRPHPATDMQPLTRLVAVSSSSGPAGRRVCEEMCMSLQNNGLKL